MKSTLEI